MHKRFYISLLLLIPLFSNPLIASAALKNQLVNHASPYLAMHGTDPVAWQDWSTDAVAQAKKENKLLYISSGYFSCHWCHVMQRESYKHKDIAALLNKYFIPVKVDRELNPALDARLIDFVERTQGYAGWPLNVFVTPEGYPLVGMVYVPQPQFKEILEKLSAQWKKDSIALSAVAKQATLELLESERTTQENSISKASINLLGKALVQQATTVWDELAGGIGAQSKFPSVPLLNGLFDQYQINKQEDVKSFLITTLDHMASQGLRDQLGGGFYRYTVDPNWQIPHFEKMLYDNALLASLYFRGAKQFKRDDYRRIAEETLEFMEKYMSSDKAVFAASLSAVDDKGIEGGSYIWQYGDLKKYLKGEQFKVADAYWKLVANEALKDGYHLVQAKSLSQLATEWKVPQAKLEQQITKVKQVLLKIRDKRSLPKDDKPVASWLALSLQAYVDGQTGNSSKARKQHYANIAAKISSVLQNKLWRNGELHRSVSGKQAIGNAGLEDYANVASAMYSYAQVNNDSTALTFSKHIAAQAWKYFYKDKRWMLSAEPLIKYGFGKATVIDDVLPSPSAMLIGVSLKMAQQDKSFKPGALALKALQQGNTEITSSPLWNASHIRLLQLYRDKL